MSRAVTAEDDHPNTESPEKNEATGDQYNWIYNIVYYVIKYFSCPTQQSVRFILLINVKMQTIVGILTFISRINTTSECFKKKS